MLAYAKYSVSVVKNKCDERIDEIIKDFCVIEQEIRIGVLEQNINVIKVNKLHKELTAINELAHMCSTLKTYGETTKKYITLDLEYVNLLWPNI